jgi:hypothetical protein
MIYYVYLAAEVVSVAEKGGAYALQVLIALLRGLLQNCLVIDFQDGRIQEALGEHVRGMQPSFDRKLLSATLGAIQKHNRFVCCLTPDLTGATPDDEVMIQQAAAALIDVAVLSTEAKPGSELPAGLEIATLATYQHTDFEPRRSKLASVGSRTEPGAQSQTDFLDSHFRKALRHASRIVLCDRLFGRKYGDNYEYTITKVLRWLEAVLDSPATCALEVHCERPPGLGHRALEGDLKAGRTGRLGSLRMTVYYYNNPGIEDVLPHERFVLTDQFAFSIDRGLDFLDKSTKRNRDVSVRYADADSCQTTLRFFARKSPPTLAQIV